ncbi:MAG TPA: cytochrome c biogenesis protein CcsA [Syntrophomonadaceae bacterium]|nr:cytochrome c biogenesis protein CcsA [Syntrophomonadaceae bacterium]
MLTVLITVIIYALIIAYSLGAVLYFVGAKTEKRKLLHTARTMAVTGCILNLLAIIVRTIIAGRLPLANGCEFMLWFTWITVLLYLIYETKSQVKDAGGVVMLIVAVLSIIVAVLMRGQFGVATPLMPALKSPWLTVHVITAAAAYAGFALAAGLAVMQLIKADKRVSEESVYRVVAGGFVMLSLTIVLGAIWAEQAWGSYWTWDPKETWALVTWLIYALYLHLQRRLKWKGKTASIMVVAGFILVLFTFFGVNYLLPGLHSYAGVWVAPVMITA